MKSGECKILAALIQVFLGTLEEKLVLKKNCYDESN